MRSKSSVVAMLTVAIGLFTGAAFAGSSDYVFEPVSAEAKQGNGVTVALRLVHTPTGKTIPGAVIFQTRIDMAPDGMADMVSPVSPLSSVEDGVYAFKTNLPMTGRYLFSIAAKVPGEAETVTGKVIFKAVK